MSQVKNLIYHGKKPPTKEDAKMAKNHLGRTISLEKSKVKEHENQKSLAKMAKNKKSMAYNDAHLKEHKKDIAKRESSKRTINQIWSKLGSLRSKK